MEDKKSELLEVNAERQEARFRDEPDNVGCERPQMADGGYEPQTDTAPAAEDLTDAAPAAESLAGAATTSIIDSTLPGISTEAFLQELYHDCEDGCITVTTLPDGRNQHISVTDIERAAGIIRNQGSRTNTYYGMALRRQGLVSRIRGGLDDIHTVVCMYADIDIKGPAHKQNDLPATPAEVDEFLKSLSLPASFIIRSGNGVHVIWCLEQPYVIHTDDERAYIAAVSSGFGSYIVSEGGKKGWKLDSVQDITRMLRAPGTLNFKSNPPKECYVLSASGLRYPLTRFEVFKGADKEDYTPVNISSEDVGPAERMRGKCAFIDHCVDEAANLPEPWWHAMLSIVALTENGGETAHAWSEPDARYDWDETEERVKRAVKTSRPCSCHYIRSSLGFSCPDEGCFKGERRVKGPIAFAVYSKDEQLDRLLASPLSTEEAVGNRSIALAAFAKKHNPGAYVLLKKKYLKDAGVGTRDLENAIKSYLAANAVNDMTHSGDPQRNTATGSNASSSSYASSAADDFCELPDSRPSLNLEGIDTTGLVVPKGWQISMNGVMRIGSDNGVPFLTSICAAPAFISRKMENIDSNTEKLELTFLSHHQWKRIIVPRGDAMDRHRLLRTADDGFPVTSTNAAALVSFLSSFEAENVDNIKFYRSISRIGWFNGTDEFFPFFTRGEVLYDGSNDDAQQFKAIRSSGDRETWMNMAVKLRQLPFARTMLAASFASVLLEPLKHRILYLHIWAMSRSGKTACEKAAISVWGNPVKLMMSYNSTMVGLERMASIMSNLPLAIDELQALTLREGMMSTIVYMLGEGFGKARGNKNGGTQKKLEWRNSILSTGEETIVKSNAMDGVSSRVMEITGAPIPDPDFAREVHQIAEQNYGFAGKDFIKILFDRYLEKHIQYVGEKGEKISGLEKLQEEYTDMMESIKSVYTLLYSDEPGSHLQNVAVLALADYISSAGLFGVDESRALGEATVFGAELLSCIQESTPADTVSRAWVAVRDWISTNIDHFDGVPNARRDVTLSPVFGRYDREKDVFFIIPGALKKAVSDAGFSEGQAIKGFKDRQLISSSQLQKRVDKKSDKVYEVHLGESDILTMPKGAIIVEDDTPVLCASRPKELPA